MLPLCKNVLATISGFLVLVDSETTSANPKLALSVRAVLISQLSFALNKGQLTKDKPLTIHQSRKIAMVNVADQS